MMLLQVEPLPEWLHILIVAITTGTPIFVYMKQQQREAEKARMQERRERDEQHIENRDRLRAIETMLGPIWNWWNTRGPRTP